MIITGNRKRTLDKRLRRLSEGTSIIIGVPAEGQEEILPKIGFSGQLEVGETVLPPTAFGPICRLNANGKEIIHKEQPKETVYYQKEWTWEEWAGRYDTVTRSDFVSIPMNVIHDHFGHHRVLNFQ